MGKEEKIGKMRVKRQVEAQHAKKGLGVPPISPTATKSHPHRGRAIRSYVLTTFRAYHSYRSRVATIPNSKQQQVTTNKTPSPSSKNQAHPPSKKSPKKTSANLRAPSAPLRVTTTPLHTTTKFLQGKPLLLLLLFLLPFPLLSQQWQNLSQYGGQNNEKAVHLATNETGDSWLLALFPGSITLAGNTLNSRGDDDLLLLRTDATGTVSWATRAGSTDKDQAAGIATDNNDNVFIAGLYWDDADFQQIDINPTQGSASASFLAKYNSDGEVLWVYNIEGQGKKDIHDLKTDAAGNVYLCGTYEGQLYVQGDTLFSQTDLSAFTLKFDNDGTLQWARSAGLAGQVNAEAIAIHETGAVVVGGDFQGSIAHAGDTIGTNTDDADLFLLQYDAQGNSQWIKKAGGIFDDRFRSLATEDGAAYLTGHFDGVLNFDSIQVTSSFNDNVFLAKYSLDGDAIWAKSLGGANYDEVEKIWVKNGQIYLAGYYDQSTTFEGITLTATDNAYDGFLANFDSNGGINSLTGIRGNGFQFPTAVSVSGMGDIALAGYFQTELSIGNLIATTPNDYDIFLLKGAISPNASIDFSQEENIQLHPNPTQEYVFINGWPEKTPCLQASIIDLNGRILQTIKLNPSPSTLTIKLQVNHLPTGSYILYLEGEGFGKALRFVVD